MTALTFHVVGDAYVDFFSYLDGDWPENGGDSRLNHPVKNYAGGSSVNTATHLQSLERHFNEETSTEKRTKVTLHTCLNQNDHYGKVLLDHAKKHGFPLVNCKRDDDESWTGHCIAIVSGGERSFMTHQGCVESFSADDLNIESIIETEGSLHIHVAGTFVLERRYVLERLTHVIASTIRFLQCNWILEWKVKGSTRQAARGTAETISQPNDDSEPCYAARCIETMGRWIGRRHSLLGLSHHE